MQKNNYKPCPVEEQFLETKELKMPRWMREILTREVGRARQKNFWLRDVGDDLALICYAYFEEKMDEFKNMEPSEFTLSVQRFIKDRLQKTSEFKAYRLAALGYANEEEEENKIEHVPIEDIVGTNNEVDVHWRDHLTSCDDCMDFEAFLEWCALITCLAYINTYLEKGTETEAGKVFGMSQPSFSRLLTSLAKNFPK